MGDPAVYPGLMQMPFASEELWRQRLTDSNAPGKSDLPVVAELRGEVAGSAGLHLVGLQLRRRHAWMLRISVLPLVQRQGVGTALMDAMCDYADNWVGALRLELGVYTDNLGAIALYRKFNSKSRAHRRAMRFLRDGQFVDSHMMVRFHPNPPRAPSR